MKFKDFAQKKKVKQINEAAGGRKVLQHLVHLEDTMLDNGYDGVETALAFVDQVRKTLAQGEGAVKKNITSKYDGSPSVIFGIDPMDGKFFVGTKAALSKNPKLIKSNKDLELYYGDQPDLANKLKYCLKYLGMLGMTGIMQGDLMFTKSMLRSENLDGKACVVFEPNTIAYSAEIDSEIGQKILQAKVGIVVHTIYHGTSVQTMESEHGSAVLEALAMLHQVPEVWIDDVTYKDYTGIASLTPEEDAELVRDITTCQRFANLIGEKQFDAIVKNPDIAKNIQIFINSRVRGGQLVGDSNKFINDFIKFYEDKLRAELANLKTGAEGTAATNKLKKVEALKQFIISNINTFVRVMEVYKTLITMKHFLIGKLQKISTLGTFLRTDDGYRVTSPEGFVVIGDTGGTIKFVDRINFSAVNAAKHAK